MSSASGAPRVLFVGGTGTISASSVRLAVARGMEVSVLNRGRNSNRRTLPDGVTQLTGDAADAESVKHALAGTAYDCVINFLTFDAEGAAQAVEAFGPVTSHYIHISTASMYDKPIRHVPLVESNLRANPYLEYARKKIEAEDLLMRAHAEDGFPVTVVRPSHTYDEASPPLAGGWTVVDRLARGAEVVVHGDGTSLWTVTHAADLAVGLVGLIANTRAVGEAFHITSDDVYTWDQIVTIVASGLGVVPRIVHVPAEFFPIAAPEWDWSELVLGDLSHSAIFDNSKIKNYVPDFAPVRTFSGSVGPMLRWREEHAVEAAADPATDRIIDRLVRGYHGARAVFESLPD